MTTQKLSTMSKFKAISEIKEDLKEIKDKLQKMQKDIDLLENNVRKYYLNFNFPPKDKRCA